MRYKAYQEKQPVQSFIKITKHRPTNHLLFNYQPTTTYPVTHPPDIINLYIKIEDRILNRFLPCSAFYNSSKHNHFIEFIIQRRIQRGACPLLFLQVLIFCNYFEELQAVLIEVKLIINNAPLTCVNPNSIKTCLPLNHLLFRRQSYIILTQHQLQLGI